MVLGDTLLVEVVQLLSIVRLDRRHDAVLVGTLRRGLRIAVEAHVLMTKGALGTHRRDGRGSLLWRTSIKSDRDRMRGC